MDASGVAVSSSFLEQSGNVKSVQLPAKIPNVPEETFLSVGVSSAGTKREYSSRRARSNQKGLGKGMRNGV